MSRTNLRGLAELVRGPRTSLFELLRSMKIVLILTLTASVTLAGDYSPLTRDYIHDYYNGNRRSEEREIRQRLLELLRDPEPEPIIIIVPEPREQK